MIPLLVRNVVGLIKASHRYADLDFLLHRLEDRACELPMADWWCSELLLLPPSWCHCLIRLGASCAATASRFLSGTLSHAGLDVAMAEIQLLTSSGALLFGTVFGAS